MMFCDISSAAMIIKWAFSIRFVNNDLSVAWESENEVWKDSILSLKKIE